jgi:hypothetical protein
MLLSAFIATYCTILPSLLRPITTIIILTLIDLINNPAYLVSLNRSLIGAFSNPFIQNASFKDLNKEGLENGIFGQIIAL